MPVANVETIGEMRVRGATKSTAAKQASDVVVITTFRDAPLSRGMTLSDSLVSGRALSRQLFSTNRMSIISSYLMSTLSIPASRTTALAVVHDAGVMMPSRL